MAGSPSPPEVIDARVRAVKSMLRRGPDTSIGFIGRICQAFNVSKATASLYLTRARREIGDALPLDDDDFDTAFATAMLEMAYDPDASISERRKVWTDLAKFKGRFRSVPLADLLVTPAPPPPSLRDPAVLAAALELDSAIERAKNPDSG